MSRRPASRIFNLAATLTGIAVTAASYRRHVLAHPRGTFPANATSSTDPRLLLDEADRLAWVFNSTRSAPLYARAEHRIVGLQP